MHRASLLSDVRHDQGSLGEPWFFALKDLPNLENFPNWADLRTFSRYGKLSKTTKSPTKRSSGFEKLFKSARSPRQLRQTISDQTKDLPDLKNFPNPVNLRTFIRYGKLSKTDKSPTKRYAGFGRLSKTGRSFSSAENCLNSGASPWCPLDNSSHPDRATCDSLGALAQARTRQSASSGEPATARDPSRL